MILSRGYRNPVLLLHPLGGWTKADDVPLKVHITSFIVNTMHYSVLGIWKYIYCTAFQVA